MNFIKRIPWNSTLGYIIRMSEHIKKSIVIIQKSKNDLWGKHIWKTGYYINTVGAYGNEEVIHKYVEQQGKQYKQIYIAQLSFFDGFG